MKKSHCLLIAVALFLLAGCTDDQGAVSKVKSKATVVETASLSDSEAGLINSFSDESLAYELTFKDSTVKQILMSIDEYNFGKLKRIFLDGGTSIEKQDREKPMRILFAREFADNGYANWTVAAISQNGDNSSMRHSIKSEELGGWATSQVSLPLELEKGKKQPVGVLIESAGGDVTSSSDFDTKEGFAELAKYDRVYLFNLEVK